MHKHIDLQKVDQFVLGRKDIMDIKESRKHFSLVVESQICPFTVYYVVW